MTNRRTRNSPMPVFTPWDGQALTIRHHQDNNRVGRITTIDSGQWSLDWHQDFLPGSTHETAQQAVGAASRLYPDFLRAEKEASREVEEEHAYREGFLRRRAGAVARAVRIPTGGQKSTGGRSPR